VNVAWPAPRTLVATGLGIVLVAAVAFAGWYWYDVQQRRIGAAYAEVMTRAYAAQTPQVASDTRARVAHDLEELIARHPSGPSAAEAAYELGNLRYAAQQYPGARGAYEMAIARGASPTVRTLARASIGYTWEAERNFAKAVEAYQLVAGDLGPKDFLYEQTLLDLARAQELAGRPADAVSTYQRLLKDFPAARRADEIRGRLVALGAPAAAPAPPPAPTTSPAGR
jgi:tetratricopeptide (TPR) repeat protein